MKIKAFLDLAAQNHINLALSTNCKCSMPLFNTLHRIECYKIALSVSVTALIGISSPIIRSGYA